MSLLDQLKKDIERYRGVPRCNSAETRREDITPGKPLVCVVCKDPIDAHRARTTEDSYTHLTEFYCPECFGAIMQVRKQENI